MNASSVLLEGFGLHGGARAVVRLSAAAGAVRLRARGQTCDVGDLRVIDTERAVTVTPPDGAFRVRTVDHLFAACAGLGVRDGLAITVEEGDELPLLDGSAARFTRAVSSIVPTRMAPRLRVMRHAVIEVHASRYVFSPPREDGGDPRVRVTIDFGDARLAPDARWDGDPGDFVSRIAPARTFAFAAEIESLLDRGLAKHVDPESVVVVAPEAIHASGLAFAADEPARHKLLDLLGDMFLYGGPPSGTVDAHRPGHGPTHTAMAIALRDGVLATSRSARGGIVPTR